MAGNLRAYLAECVGTFALVFIGAGSVCADALTGGKVGAVGVALAYGLAFMAMCSAYGCGGGFYNPAVTTAMLVHRRINTLKGVLYISIQLLGAALAALALKKVLNQHETLFTAAPYLGACDLFDGIGFKAGTFLEALATFFLMTAVYATTIDSRGMEQAAPAVIGMTMTAGVLAIGPLTGGALNPARSFGPAIVTGHWAHWFVYWIGPLAGALAASWIYENLYIEKKK